MIVIDGSSLDVAAIVAVAARRDPDGVSVTVTEGARERARRSQEFAAARAAERPIYGRSTGVGANRTVALDDDPAARRRAARSLLRSHATAAGPLRSAERVRALLVIRLNQLAAGASGADPAIMDALAEMITADALPPVRELGSIGTADLPALAITALALLGEVPTSQPLPRSVELGISDALPFLSSNAAALADAALALGRLRQLLDATVAVAALSFTAVSGNSEAFTPAVERATPFPGARWVCRSMTALVAAGPGDPVGAPARIQDPFGLRALPQVHGPLVDAVASAERVVTGLVNAAAENPSLSPEHGVAHHGGFHAAYLGQALDAVALAVAQSAQLSLARLTMLDEPALSGLAPFLGDGTPGASGTMIVEYVAASALAQLRQLAQPVGLQTVTLSRGVEEDASFASLAASQLLDSAEHWQTVLACELVAAARAVRAAGIRPGGALAEILRAAGQLEVDLADRDLTVDIEQAAAALAVIAQIMSSSGLSSSA